jgi:hypothetical protein
MNKYEKRTKPPTDNDDPRSFLLPTGTIATRPGGTPRAGPVPPTDSYNP